MNGPSEYELQIRKNIEENKKILANLGLDKFKVSQSCCLIDRWTHVYALRSDSSPSELAVHAISANLHRLLKRVFDSLHYV